MFTEDDWRKLVDKLIEETESGKLQWCEDEDNASSNARQFSAEFGVTRVSLFGRFRGFSYELNLLRDQDGQSVFEDSIKAPSKKNSHDIQFNVLFKAVRQQIIEAEQLAQEAARDEIFTRILNKLDQLQDHNHSALRLEEEEDVEVPLAGFTYSQWQVLVDRLTERTDSGELTWIAEDGRTTFNSETMPFGFEFWVDEPELSLFVTYADEAANIDHIIGDSTLEKLRNAIIAPYVKADEQFNSIVKDDIMHSILTDLEQKNDVRSLPKADG